MKDINSIDDVIAVLDEIILVSEETGDTLGYFAVLYRRVTWKVKEGIDTGYFDNPERMEKLDIIFARRYIDAYYDYQSSGGVTASWNKAFVYSKEYWPIVLQHLLIGMNAHINLDLGIAAAEVSGKANIQDLREDFYKINNILAALVNEVQLNLTKIWAPLKQLLLKTRQYDNLLVDFSMEIARDGAWRFACLLSETEEDQKEACIVTRDTAISKKAGLVTSHGLVAKIILGIIRLGERGSVSEKIKKLKYVKEEKLLDQEIFS